MAVEANPGNAGDPSTLASQIAKARSRFGISRVALVGDRGMTASARIREDLRPADLDWISALKTADIRKLL
ncbi:MAG: IS1634 family transposase, partial [Albidovulum sp.]|nr:IS1634 family transposase [Albidovulum sp.]